MEGEGSTGKFLLPVPLPLQGAEGVQERTKQVPESYQILNINFIENFFKREKNEPLYKLYNIIIGNGEDGVTYSKLSKVFTKTYGKKIKMDHQTVAHYCKKLEKQGFIIWTTLQKNSERKVFPREEYINKFRRIVSTFYPSIYYLDRFPYKMYKNEEAHQVIENLLDMISYPLWRSKPKEVVIDEDIQPQSQVCCVDFNEMTIREWIINLIDWPEKYLNVQKPEGLTISEIADAVGLTNEEKLISRILSDIQKKNSYIKSQAFRLGRIFWYKYYSTRKQKNLGVQKLSTNLTRNTELRSDERKEENKQVRY